MFTPGWLFGKEPTNGVRYWRLARRKLRNGNPSLPRQKPKNAPRTHCQLSALLARIAGLKHDVSPRRRSYVVHMDKHTSVS